MDLILTLFLLHAVRKAHADVITWIGPDTDFNNEYNWKDLKTPSSSESVVFDGLYDFAVEFPAGDTQACEIILPRSGEIIFPEDMTLGIGGQDGNSRCIGEAVFATKNSSYWVDPQNWQGKDVNLATPDLERLPCENDTVVFPAGKTYSVYLPAPMVGVKEFVLNGKSYGWGNLYTETTVDIVSKWSKMFSLDPFHHKSLWDESESGVPEFSILVNTLPCEDENGCVCRYLNQEDVEEENACHIIRERCEPQPPCQVPVLPYGSCCPLCGAQLLFKFGNNSSFNLNSFREKVRDVVLHFSTQKKPVDFHVSRTFHDTIQVVLVEQGQYEGYVEELMGLILNMVESNPHIGLTPHHRITHSGYPYDPNGGLGTLSILLLSAILSLGVLMAVYVHFYHDGWAFLGLARLGRTQLDSAFVFKRFEEESTVYEVTPRKPAKCFDNPMYNVETSDTAAASSASTKESGTPLAPSFQELKEKYDDAPLEDD